VVKGVWAYIKENNLQNPANKSEIVPDSKLKVGLKSDQVAGLSIRRNMFGHWARQQAPEP
jgi:upstream activation factor subunit UAF30